jgi:hypothetical protein
VSGRLHAALVSLPLAEEPQYPFLYSGFLYFYAISCLSFEHILGQPNIAICRTYFLQFRLFKKQSTFFRLFKNLKIAVTLPDTSLTFSVTGIA